MHALYSFDTKKKIEQLIEAEKPDIVHINLVHRHITLSILNAIQKYNIPVVFLRRTTSTACALHTLCFAATRCATSCVAEHSYKPALEQKCVKNSALQTYLAVIEAKNFKMKMYDKNDFYICPSDTESSL